MTTETRIKFAKRIKRAPSYVTELIKHGRMVLTEDGKKVEVEASLKRIEETASGANPAVAARHEAARNGEQLQLQDGTRAKFKSMVMQYENQGLKIEMMLKRHLRFQKKDVLEETQAIGNTVRTSLERLVDLSAPKLAATTSRAERAAIINREVTKIKRIINSEFTRALRRLQKD